MVKVIVIVICTLLAIGSYAISILQFKEKGFLFNNAYLWASAEERKTMDKKPHYKQSGIVFLFIGTLFLLIALEILLDLGWVYYFLFFMLVFAAVVYAIISSVKIEKRR